MELEPIKPRRTFRLHQIKVESYGSDYHFFKCIHTLENIDTGKSGEGHIDLPLKYFSDRKVASRITASKKVESWLNSEVGKKAYVEYLNQNHAIFTSYTV